ncbi:MAG: hypothetical protein LLG00_15930 [Planctomycetaceae bacterium]|nr:hypothetical protein [Planctomycetaceae bacterium]
MRSTKPMVCRGDQIGLFHIAPFTSASRLGPADGVVEDANLRAESMCGRLSPSAARVMAKPTLLRLGLCATPRFSFQGDE